MASLVLFQNTGMFCRQVLHGSDSDILWLQRDLGLYVVNMFDTGQVRYTRMLLISLLLVTLVGTTDGVGQADRGIRLYGDESIDSMNQPFHQKRGLGNRGGGGGGLERLVEGLFVEACGGNGRRLSVLSN